jgi:hypothetical protein
MPRAAYWSDVTVVGKAIQDSLCFSCIPGESWSYWKLVVTYSANRAPHGTSDVDIIFATSRGKRVELSYGTKKAKLCYNKAASFAFASRHPCQHRNQSKTSISCQCKQIQVAWTLTTSARNPKSLERTLSALAGKPTSHRVE